MVSLSTPVIKKSISLYYGSINLMFNLKHLLVPFLYNLGFLYAYTCPRDSGHCGLLHFLLLCLCTFLALLVSQSKESGELRGEGEAQGKGYKAGCSALGLYELREPVLYSTGGFFLSQLHWKWGVWFFVNF